MRIDSQRRFTYRQANSYRFGNGAITKISRFNATSSTGSQMVDASDTSPFANAVT